MGAEPQRPNIVFVITDNQGAWTLGCYGNEEIKTPQVDRLASEGVLFTSAYCVNPVCSPNRATYLTGRIPSQHGVHNWLGGERPDSQIGPDAYCTIEEFETLPGILADQGYDCGMSGKWHLGDSLRPQLGFDYWFAKPKGHTKTFYGAEAIWKGEVYSEPRYFTEVITDHAVDFLRSKREEPFFLYVGYNGPYGLGDDMRGGHQNRWTPYYQDKDLRCFPREEIHPWLVHNRDIINTPSAIAGYAAAVSGVDDGLGRILETLGEIGAAENTIVVFTADQGLCGGHHGMWGMGDHSRPMHMFEENMRIPLVIRHPAGCAGGRSWDGMVCTYDFYPSVLSVLEVSKPPICSELPGRDYSAVLDQSAAGDVAWDDTVFHEYEDTRAIRTRRWKYIRRHPGGRDELYDMSDDPGEGRNLAGSAEHTAVLKELDAKLVSFFADNVDPRYDLWNQGTTKAGRAIPELADT